MMHRMHVSTLQRRSVRAVAAGVAVFAAIAAQATTLTAQALVQGVRVESDTKGTVVAVTLTDSVARSAFTLAGPNRIVLDLPGATLGALGGRSYDGQPRGPVQNVRMAQYRSDVVRVVIDVDGAARYSVSGGNEVRIAMAGGREVAGWSTGDAMPSARVTTTRDAAVAASMDSTIASGHASAGDAVSQVAYQTPEMSLVGTPSMSRGKPPKPRITVGYQDADIRDVIAAFASFANRTIIVGREVTGSVTADVKDKPWDEALAAILSAQGLAASEEPNGIIIVDSYKNMLDKQSLEPLVTQVVSINYANASSVAGTVRGLLTRDCLPGAGGPSSGAGGSQPGSVPNGCVVRGSVQADSATNSLLIREVQSRMDDVINYVRSIDRRTPQVAIKAKIIFVNRSSLQEIGITYDIGTARQFFNTVIPRQETVSQIPIDRNGDGVPDAFRQVLQPVVGDRVDLGGKTLSAIANANSSIGSPALNLIFSAALGKYSLTPFIQALQESSLADVQAEPTVVTLDNRKAEILVGQEIPIRVLDAGAGAAGGSSTGQINIPRATVQLKEVGISLTVTPRITNNRQIMMTIHAENSSASLASSDVGFIFDKQRADNTLMVPDGETAVIGGLTITQVTKSRRGVPFLMDIPYLGRLFSTSRKNEQKRDLVILVSPHILDDGEAARTPVPNPSR
jgi:type IV pilus assembly protein PilQ